MADVRDQPTRLQRAGSWLFSGHLLAVFSIAASNILLGFTFLTAPFSLRFRRGDWSRMAPLLAPLGIYALWLVGAAFASFDPWASLGGLRELFTLSAVLLAPGLVRGEAQVRRLVDGLTAAAALLAAVGLASYLWGYGDIDRRIRGPFSHYMTFSGFLLICDLLLMVRLLSDPRGSGGRRGWRWAALVVINVALLASYTRSAWVALVVAVTVLLLIQAPKLLLAYLPLGVLLVVLAPVPLVSRMISIVDLQDPSNYDRLCMLEAGMTMVKERPLFGLGPEMAERRYPIYRSPTAPRFDVPHLHNSFLQLAAERGIPALLAYLAMNWVSLRAMYIGYRQEGGRRGPRADLYLGGLLALLAFNVAGLFEDNWGDTEVQRPALFLLVLPFCLLMEETLEEAPADMLPDRPEERTERT
ncbi:MAG TPA: O-antigen ligase family protein [Thermoanaerobaculia bacterium]|nr:O-antigen ligase family protein [Thermoanaerobaculia bacterium]